MSKTIKVLIAVAAAAAILAVGGKYVGIAALTALMPVYTLLLFSVVLVIFLAIAVLLVPIARSMAKHSPEEDTGVKEVEKDAEEPRKVA